MLLSKEVEIRLNKSNISHYESLDYDIPKVLNADGSLIVSSKTKITVRAVDLQLASKIKVDVKCDYCNIVFSKDYYSYLQQRKNIAKDCCNNTECMKQKRAESNIKKYGVEHTINIPGVKEKMKQTNINKYGCEYAVASAEVRDNIEESFLNKYGVSNPFEIEDVQDRIKQTCLDKYGVDHYNKTEESKERHKETCLERYGYDNVSKSPEIINKIKETQVERFGSFYSQTDESKERFKQTCLEKYGVENPFQSEEVKNRIIEFNLETYGMHPMQVESIKQDRIKKMVKTKYRNGSMQTSRQQEYLHILYGGKINYPVDRCSLDVALLDNMIYIEYDGSGHNLSVKFGDINQEDFNRKEMQRKYYLINLGWNEIRIISVNDNLPQDQVLLDMFEISKIHFDRHSWIKFDIDNSKIMTSVGEFDYDYGCLRKITENDLRQK